MRGRLLLRAFAAIAMAFSASAAAAAAVPLDIREGSLATALSDLARQAGVELLFDSRLVRGKAARPVRGRLTAEAALARLLSGSGLGYRATPQGAFVLFTAPVATSVAAPSQASGDGAIAELLVVGRRTQNVDIRRTENDIQPYRIMGRREIEASGRSSLNEVLRARESANTQAGSPTLEAETRSRINLRGFGEASTLVLVDGRRMPFYPSPLGDFLQADVNGIPLGAIERIEVLTTTAGGIYGPGAIGGVVNVVVRRDYRGADLTVQAGITDRGDARESRFEARLGFTPDHGATDVMLFLADSRATSLNLGERNYLERAGRRAFANDPSGYAASLPTRDGIAVASLSGENLTLDPEYGGAALGSPYTFLPIGFGGTKAEAGAQLRANAGRLPLDLTDDLVGARGDLATSPHITSVMLNVRRRIGSRLELFADGFHSRSRGHLVDAIDPGSFTLGANRSGNPFGQNIRVSFPQALLARDYSTRTEVSRGTAGAIVDLAGGWKASADYTMGRTAFRGREAARTEVGLQPAVLGSFDAFGSWPAVLAALPSYFEDTNTEASYRGRSNDLALRLAGPVVTLPGGPLSATLLAEQRMDRVLQSSIDFFGLPLLQGERSQRVRSAYAEVRAPIGAPDSEVPLLRGLELQLAVRHDRITQRGPVEAVVADPSNRFAVRSHSTTFTAGARVSPIRALTLRGSFATGERPPTLTDLQALSGDFIIVDGPPDPRRGGRPLSTEVPFDVLLGGSLRVGSARAQSVTLGAVLNPEGRGGPRLSLDYSRIVVSREPMVFPLDAPGLLAAEAMYPDRVIRAPVTAADRAQGFTVGPVILLDFASQNIGRTVVEAVDARLDWRLRDLKVGDVRLYGALTWQPKLRQTRFDGLPVNAVNGFEGPLEWRGNGGVEWTRGPTVVDLNAQYFGRYRVSTPRYSVEDNAGYVRAQGSDRVPAQVYVDVSVRRRFALAGLGRRAAVDARLSVLNLFDHAPPIVTRATFLGFSDYGDPRRRRLVLSLAAQF